MAEKIMLKIGTKEDRETVATILYRNGYRVEPAKIKVKKSYDYYVVAEPLDTIDITNSQEGATDAD